MKHNNQISIKFDPNYSNFDKLVRNLTVNTDTNVFSKIVGNLNLNIKVFYLLRTY